MTRDEAVEKLRELGWCYSHTHPYSGPYDQIVVGPRGKTEGYGPFPEGWVDAEYGRGDTLIEALEAGLIALQRERAKHPRCQMPGCSVEVPKGDRYCEACSYVKEDELRRAAEQKS